MTGIRVQNISQFGGGQITDGFLKTELALNSTNQQVKDYLGNTSQLNLGTNYTGWLKELAGLITDSSNRNSFSIFKVGTGGGTAAGYKFIVKGSGKIGIGALGGSYSPTASLDIFGEGTTAATKSLIIQNINGVIAEFRDDGVTTLGGSLFGTNITLSGALRTVFLNNGDNSQTVLNIANVTGDVGVLGAVVASSMWSFHSTTKGILFPRMTTAQRNAIGSPANSLTVFDTDLDTICFYSSLAGGWRQVSNSAA